MALQTVVTSQSDVEVSRAFLEDSELLDVLGSREEAIAVQLQELIRSVKESVQEALDSEGELSIEISGSLELKAAAGVGYLFFNVGADTSKNNTMKVTFKTKISPKETDLP